MFDAISSTTENENPIEHALLVGRVVFNNDPARQQRVKVVIANYLSGDPDTLPWIGPSLNSPFGVTRTHGTVNVPVVGSLVLVKFQGGDLNNGIYSGCISTSDLGAAMPSELSTNYPNRYGFFDPKGNKFYQDLTSGVTEFLHNSGTRIKFDANGDLIATVVGNLNANVTGNTTASIGGSITATVAGSVTCTAASWSITGPITFNSPVTFTDIVDATLITASTDVVAVGKSLKNHIHKDSRNGDTTPPQ